MGLERLLHTKMGINMISIVLGIGFATLFRKMCHAKNCIQFNGPILQDIDGKTYKHGEKCYQYSYTSATCQPTKQIVTIKDNVKEPLTNKVEPFSIKKLSEDIRRLK